MNKFVIIDGKKFKADPSDEAKALMDASGNPIPFVEEAPMPTGSLEDRAKNDPELARLLAEKKRLEDEANAKADATEKERQETLRKNGEFQKLAEEAEARALKATNDMNQAKNVLENYKTTIDEICADMMAQIPEDKKSLVPDEGSRKRIEYIKKNAKFLGVSLVPISAGGEVPKNGEQPALDNEGKLKKEFSELLAKPSLTQSEQTRMTEVSKMLKEIQNRKG